MSNRLRLKVKDQTEEYKVLINSEARTVYFEEFGIRKEFINLNELIEYLAQFCYSGEL